MPTQQMVQSLRRAGIAMRAAELRTCRGCGWDEDHACIGTGGATCNWVLIDLDAPTGICSFCAEIGN
jgi:hypothetical protein